MKKGVLNLIFLFFLSVMFISCSNKNNSFIAPNLGIEIKTYDDNEKMIIYDELINNYTQTNCYNYKFKNNDENITINGSYI